MSNDNNIVISKEFLYELIKAILIVGALAVACWTQNTGNTEINCKPITVEHYTQISNGGFIKDTNPLYNCTQIYRLQGGMAVSEIEYEDETANYPNSNALICIFSTVVAIILFFSILWNLIEGKYD